MAPIIASSGQTRSRLPPKWMQTASLKSAAPAAKPADRTASLQESPIRWSTHTLAADPNDTIRSRADSTTSTYVDTFAHRRKSRISDLTFVDHLEDAVPPQLTTSDSLTSSLNDLSLTLNNDEDSSHGSDLPHYEATSAHDFDHNAQCSDPQDAGLEESDDDEDYDDELAQRIDRLMAATMEALEASNRLVLDTLSSRAKLAQLNAMEAALDSHLDAREAHLHRQIQAVTDMTEFVSKTSAELQQLTSPANSVSTSSGASSASQLTSLADPAELQVRGAAATGIVQALDRDATIGKTAAKRLERMLQTPSPTSSPASVATSAQLRGANPARRAFSISNFSAVQSSIAEESHHEQGDSPSTPRTGSDEQDASGAATPSNMANSAAESRTSTPQKKRSISYDSRASGAIKLMAKLSVPSRASSSGFVPSSSMLTAPSLMAGAASSYLTAESEMALDQAVSPVEARPISRPSASKASNKPTMRPSLMAALRQDSALASSSSSLVSNATVRPESTTRSHPSSASGLPIYNRSVSLKASADVAATSTAAESTLAALLGMPSAAASASSRTDTPSESSYFDSAMEDSISSASPPTPGSIHAIHDVLATPWKPTAHAEMRDGADVPSSQERSTRRSSMQHSSLVSPRASLSLSDRDRAQQLSSHLAELRAERVTWNPQSVGDAEAGTSGTLTSGSSARGGGALRALQKLNEMSAAKIAGHGSANGEANSSKRVSLGLGLPSFSALRPSASRSASTTVPSAVESLPFPSTSPSATFIKMGDETAAPQRTDSDPKPMSSRTSSSQPDADTDVNVADTSSSSLLGGGWRSWASWNAASAAPSGDSSTPQK